MVSQCQYCTVRVLYVTRYEVYSTHPHNIIYRCNHHHLHCQPPCCRECNQQKKWRYFEHMIAQRVPIHDFEFEVGRGRRWGVCGRWPSSLVVARQQQRPRLCTSTDIIKHQSRQSIAETEGVVRGSILSPRMPFFFGEAVAHASGLQSAVSRVTLILVRNEFFPTFFALANNK